MNDVLSETKRLLSVKRIALSATKGRRPLGAFPVSRIVWGDASRNYLSNFLRATANPLAAITASAAAAPRGAASPIAGRLAVCEESSLPLAFSPSPFALEPSSEPLLEDPLSEPAPEPEPESEPPFEPLLEPPFEPDPLSEPLSEPAPPLLPEPVPEPFSEPLSEPGPLSPSEPDPPPAFSS